MGKSIRLKPKGQPTYKYRLNHFIGLLPRTITIGKLIAHLVKENISRSEFYQDRDIPFGSDRSIPSDRLKKYAIIFDCTEDELMNHKVTAKPLRLESGNKVKSGLQ